jgi:hypothetical protein
MIGTITKCNDTHFDLLTMARGGTDGFDPTNDLNRLGEIETLWKESGCSNVSLLKSKFDFIDDAEEPEWVNFIENTYDLHKYECLLMPPLEDSHCEHRFAAHVAHALTRYVPLGMVEYKTVSALQHWSPNLFVDVTELMSQKMKLLEDAFQSQRQKKWFASIEPFHFNFRCQKRGIERVEQFRVTELVQR